MSTEPPATNLLHVRVWLEGGLCAMLVGSGSRLGASAPVMIVHGDSPVCRSDNADPCLERFHFDRSPGEGTREKL
jgi:hypothetical protein